MLLSTNASAPLGITTRYSLGDLYGGYRHGYEAGATARINERFNISAALGRNDIRLPQGSFITTLLTSRVNYNFSTRMFVNGLFQYNADTQQVTSNVRLNLIHRPLSDLFVVYNDNRDAQSRDLIDRAVVVKFTYLVAF